MDKQTLRDRFFQEHTTSFSASDEKLARIITAPHDLFEWMWKEVSAQGTITEEIKERCPYELFVEDYFGRTFKEKELIPDADFGQIVNLLACFSGKQKSANAQPKETVQGESREDALRLLNQIAQEEGYEDWEMLVFEASGQEVIEHTVNALQAFKNAVKNYKIFISGYKQSPSQ